MLAYPFSNLSPFLAFTEIMFFLFRKIIFAEDLLYAFVEIPDISAEIELSVLSFCVIITAKRNMYLKVESCHTRKTLPLRSRHSTFVFGHSHEDPLSTACSPVHFMFYPGINCFIQKYLIVFHLSRFKNGELTQSLETQNILKLK